MAPVVKKELLGLAFARLTGRQASKGLNTPAQPRPVGKQRTAQPVTHQQGHGPVVQALMQHILLAHDTQGCVVFVHNLQQFRSVV